MRRRWIWMVPLGIVGIVVFSFLGGQVVRLLWNWLLPPLFGWPEVTFWQALGLLVLCRILFGGRGGGYRSGSRMSAEQRARFRQRMRERFGYDGSAEEPNSP